MKHVFQFASVDAAREVESFLPEVSIAQEEPKFVILAGAIAVGKSEKRRRYYTSKYATIDAGDIFLSLCRNRLFGFPPTVFSDEVEWIGREVTRRAFSERRNIVCELSLIPFEEFQHVIAAIKMFGYLVEIEFLDCDMNEAIKRNAGRRKDSISSYYTDAFHINWISHFLRI